MFRRLASKSSHFLASQADLCSDPALLKTMKYFIRRFIIVGIVLGLTIFLFKGTDIFVEPSNEVIVKKEILKGSTFSVLASEAGVTTSTVQTLLKSVKYVYNLARITAGKEIKFVFDRETGVLKSLVYEIDNEEKLEVENIATTSVAIWYAERVPIEYTIKIDQATGIITSSLYETIVNQGLDQRLALALAEMFAWQIDFAAQIQEGDSFKVIYEKRYRDGVYDRPGKVLAAEFTNVGETFQGFYFEGEETNGAYYDENGNSLQKEFLKAPLQYKYISSGFSYRRFNPILKRFTAHRGIDYAAPHGTPVVSVGDGTVVGAGWSGYYGIRVAVRHNEMYTTIYGHFSSIVRGIRVGTRVRQGQIIGYVGSTGLSTGPHLHYEMHKFGTLVNPFREKIPPGEPVKEVDREAFKEMQLTYQAQLEKL